MNIRSMLGPNLYNFVANTPTMYYNIQGGEG